MCDLAYAIQCETLERQALAQLALAPHLKEGTQIDTPETAVAEFDVWLHTKPESDNRSPAEQELAKLMRGM